MLIKVDQKMWYRNLELIHARETVGKYKGNVRRQVEAV